MCLILMMKAVDTKPISWAHTHTDSHTTNSSARMRCERANGKEVKNCSESHNTINSHCVYAAAKEFILIKIFGAEHTAELDKKTMTSACSAHSTARTFSMVKRFALNWNRMCAWKLRSHRGMGTQSILFVFCTFSNQVNRTISLTATLTVNLHASQNSNSFECRSS